MGRMGKAVEPLFRAQGFNWKLDVSLIAGVGAKEIVASTVGVLYAGDSSFADIETFTDDADAPSDGDAPTDGDINSQKLSTLHTLMAADGITPLGAYCYLLFVLIYFPCVATIIAIKNETGSWRWAAIAAIYTTALAWLISAAVYQVGSLF